MKKVGLILLSLLSMNFASAVELSDVLAEIDQSLVVLIALFLISFSVAFFSLNKVFKDNRTITGVIAGALAFLVIYGINKIEFDTQNFFYNIGISESAFSLAIFLVIIAGIVYMVISLKKKKDALLILGALLTGLSFFVYAKALLMTAGIILLIIWFFVSVKKKGNKISVESPLDH